MLLRQWQGLVPERLGRLGDLVLIIPRPVKHYSFPG